MSLQRNSILTLWLFVTWSCCYSQSQDTWNACHFIGDSLVVTVDSEGDTMWRLSINEQGVVLGKFIRHHEGGGIFFEGCTRNGWLDGELRFYYKTGQISSIMNYDHGVLLSGEDYFKSGKLKIKYIANKEGDRFIMYHRYNRFGNYKKTVTDIVFPFSYYAFGGSFLKVSKISLIGAERR